MKISIQFSATAWKQLEQLRISCGYASIPEYLAAAARLKKTVDEQFREGRTEVMCRAPGETRVFTLTYTPSLPVN